MSGTHPSSDSMMQNLKKVRHVTVLDSVTIFLSHD